MTEPHRRALPHPAWTFTAALGVFLGLLALLAWQVRAGRDPALKGFKKTAQAAVAPRRVLLRKVIRKVIDDKVVLIAPAPVTQSAAASYTGSAPSSGAPAASYTPPSTSYSAPPPVVYSAPAPAPAPAPAVTRTS